MCYCLHFELVPRSKDRERLDLSDNAVLERLHTSADEYGLEIVNLPGMGGARGCHLDVVERGSGCACGVASERHVDDRVFNFARSLARSLDLEAVRLLWLWSNDEPLADEAMSFEAFEAKNRQSEAVNNTPYLLTRQP